MEKPFGRDLELAIQLEHELAALFSEDQIYRIYDYLREGDGSEFNGTTLCQRGISTYWDRHSVASVQITFKEDFGTEGRGGYFDNFGIIRDVIEIISFEILSLVAMEPPVSLDAEHVRDEKTKLLRSIPPLVKEEL